MNALLVSKPLAAVLSVTAVATLVLGTQLALSQVPTQAPADGQASVFNLDVTVDVEESGKPTGSVSATQVANDPFAEVPKKGVEVRFQQDEQPTWDQTIPFDLKPRTPAEQRIAQALAGQLTERIDFADTALVEVVMYLADVYEIQILLDEEALNDVGISPEESVTVGVRDVSLRSALRIVLGKLDLTYRIRNEVLMITTPEEAENNLETRVYPVGYLELDELQLQEVILATVAPDSWVEVGSGEGAIKPLEGNLVISQTQAVHEQICQLFWQLSQALEQSRN